jgi:uncharacterized membrane protein
VVSTRTVRLGAAVAALVCLLIAASFLWQASGWQDAIHTLMGMEPPGGARPFLIGAITLAVFLVTLGLARLFRWVFHALSVRLRPYVPERLAYLVGRVFSVVLFWTLIDGVLLHSAPKIFDRSSQELDALIDSELPRPLRAGQTGSAASLVNWEDLGRQGRRFVAGGPTGEDLSDFFGATLPAPIRVYVGLNSAEAAEQRARLALQELIRVGAFERGMLLLVTLTGTDWGDPGAQDTIEYRQRGDIATVTAQYSYLNSPLALMQRVSDA